MNRALQPAEAWIWTAGASHRTISGRQRERVHSAAVSPTNATSLDPHRTWGTVLMVLSLILLILALIAWASRATVIWTFVLALLVIVDSGTTMRYEQAVGSLE